MMEGQPAHRECASQAQADVNANGRCTVLSNYALKQTGAPPPRRPTDLHDANQGGRRGYCQQPLAYGSRRTRLAARPQLNAVRYAARNRALGARIQYLVGGP